MNIKAKGIVRKLDDLNRLVIPMEFCKAENFKENQALDIFLDDGKIVLKKYELSSESSIIERRILYFSTFLYETHGIENCVMKTDFNGVKKFSKINCDDIGLDRNNGKKAYNKSKHKNEKIKFTVKELNSFKYQLIYNLPSHKLVLLSNTKLNQNQKEIAENLISLI